MADKLLSQLTSETGEKYVVCDYEARQRISDIESGVNSKKVISANTSLSNGVWYLVDTNCTLTLPLATLGNHVKISTVENASNVVVVPQSGQTVNWDSDGIALDRKNCCVELYGKGTNWIIIEINGGGGGSNSDPSDPELLEQLQSI